MEWLNTSASSVLWILLSTVGIYFAIILFTRLNGLRTFSKMSSFDFAITVATGSVIASTVVSPTPSLLEGAAALIALLACQRFVSWLRSNTSVSVTDNEPVLLMAGGTFFRDTLLATRVTEDDIYGKLREANVLDFDQVQAVVLESTGDISVLHGDLKDKRLNPALLQGVKNKERFEKHRLS